MNHGKRRRIAKEARRVHGESGHPNPMGNRAYRRSPDGRKQLRLLAEKIAANERPAA